MHAPQTPTRPARFGGLDGLRAIAVALVVAYHLFPAALPGGFLGVDLFFVISGFLITSLLLDERRRRGRIALGAFWKRRARRLLPALGLVLLVCTSGALAVGGGALLTDIGAQLLGSALFVANWVFIALGSDYFAQAQPELFRNMWSLAIEEQFYLFLPLVLLLVLRMRARASRALFFGALALGSATWMSSLFLGGATASRVYFGTDTHIFGLLLGVALANAVTRSSGEGTASADARPAPLSTAQQVALICVAAAGLAIFGTLAWTLREGSPASFTGGIQLAVVAGLVAVWAVTRRGAWVGAWLDAHPLRWIGERSYGIYLWHWPLLLIVTQALAPSAFSASEPDAFDSASAALPLPLTLGIGALTLALTLGFATLSYRYVEQPVRRYGLRRTLQRLARPATWQHRRMVTVGIVMLATVAVTLPATGIALASAPDTARNDSVVRRGQAVLEAQQDGRPNSGAATHDAPHRADSSAPSAPSTDTSPLPISFDTTWAQQPHFEMPKPDPYQGWQISAIGDSVMLASAPELTETIPDIWIDAAVSRGLSAGVGLTAELAAQGALREVLVVGLGTNGPVSTEDLDALRNVAGGRPIVLVNAYGDRWWIPEVNAQLAAYAEQHRGVTLADWNAAIAQVPGGLAPDEIHPNPSGGVAYAQSVRTALDALLEREEQPARKR